MRTPERRALIVAADAPKRIVPSPYLFVVDGKPIIQWEIECPRAVKDPHFRLGSFSSVQTGLRSRTIRRPAEIAGRDRIAVAYPSMRGEPGIPLLLNRNKYRDLPDSDECLSLPETYGASPDIVRHSKEVAEAGGNIARRLNRSERARLNIDLAIAAALLHDIAIGMPCHALAGAAVMRKEGFPILAESIGAHSYMELPGEDAWTIGVKGILSIAGKRSETIRRLKSRMQSSLKGAIV